jgi:hypothetical protein
VRSERSDARPFIEKTGVGKKPVMAKCANRRVGDWILVDCILMVIYLTEFISGFLIGQIQSNPIQSNPIQSNPIQGVLDVAAILSSPLFEKRSGYLGGLGHD